MPPREPQVVESRARRAPSDDGLRTQYLVIPDTGAAASIVSRPTWLRGAEHGVNEHRVAIGNEKIWTVDDPRGAPPALLGMDLVALVLDRAHDADEGLSVLTTLLAEHGLAMPNLGDIDEQTVAGAIATGTHGTGATQSTLASCVEAVKLVIGTGEVLSVGRDDPIFPAARLGLVEGVELLPETRVAGRLRSVRTNGSHLFLRYGLR